MLNGRIGAIALALIRITLGALFLWAAITKLPNIKVFAEEVARYRLLPPSVVPFFAVCVICAEVVCGVMLIVGVAVRAAASLAAAILISFTIATWQALARQLDLSCGCFGGSEPASAWTIVRDMLMLAACVPLLWQPDIRARVWPGLRPAR